MYLKKALILFIFTLITVSMTATLPFIENWSSGDFSTNGWTFDPAQGNWSICTLGNNYEDIAEFFFGDQTDYSFALVSPVLDATSSSEVTLDYEINYDHYFTSGNEYFSVEVFDGTAWQEITSYNNSTAFQPWLMESFDLTNIVAGTQFQIRFRAHGADCYDINWWWLDNILVNDDSALPDASVNGYLVDFTTGDPISNGVIELDGVGNISLLGGSAGSGNYAFEYEDLESGSYLIRASAAGYQPCQQSFSVNSGDELEITLQMHPIIDNPAPSWFNAEPINMTDVELEWTTCQDDPTLELSYDDGSADLFWDFQGIGDSQIVATEFQYDQNVDLKYLSFYIDFGMTIPVGDDPYLKCYLVSDDNGNPDLDNILAGPIVINDFPGNTPTDPYWLQFPMQTTLVSGQTVFACLEWHQTQASADYFQLGADISAPLAEMSVASMDGGNTWMPLSGTNAMDLMIRIGAHVNTDITNRELLGYNVYRDAALINAAPVLENFYIDSGLLQGTYGYYVKALYDDGESEATDTISVDVGFLTPPNVMQPSFHFDGNDPYVRIFFLSPFDDDGSRDLLGFNIYRNSTLLNNELIPISSYEYSDYDISNTENYEYYMEAVYDEGISDPSNIVSIQILFPPQDVYGLPFDDRAELYWSAPETPTGNEISGYNVYRFGSLLNASPITEMFFIDNDVVLGNEYFYNITAVYQDDESIFSKTVELEIGEEVMLPATDLTANVVNQDVELNWQRPQMTGEWFSWDANNVGGSFAMPQNADFMAAVEYDEWDLIQFDSNELTRIAFYPMAYADFTLKIWTNDFFNPGSWMQMVDLPIDDIEIGEWNIVQFNALYIDPGFTKFLIGIVCENYSEAPLAFDEGPCANEKADRIGEIDNWQHLSTDFATDANWKIRGFMDYYDSGGIWWRNLESGSFEVVGYNIYRDNQQIAAINDIETCYLDENLNADEYTYHITTMYYVMNAVLLESEATAPVTVQVTEAILPPVNLTIDPETALLSWEAPAENAAQTSQKKVEGYKQSRNLRELESYNVYLNDELLANQTHTSFQFEDLENGVTYTAGVEAVYTSGISEMVTIDFQYEGTNAGNNIQNITKLIGNYPNPFNPTTTIRFSLDDTLPVSISIYNIKGELVRQLVNSSLEAGSHAIIWNGRDDDHKKVSSGMYLYKMRTQKYSSTHKMLLLK